MKRLLVLLFVVVLCGSLVLTGCSNAGQEKEDEDAEVKVTEAESTKTEAAESEVTQADIEETIIGSWILAERDGQPALTNEKGLFTFVSPTKAYVSASYNARPEQGSPWVDLLEADVEITDNKVTLTWPVNEDTIIVDEFTVSSITDSENQGDLIVKSVKDGKERILTEEAVSLVKVNDDYSKDILGTWEGRCTSEDSEFDDGQEHRWEYKEDGTYVYYVKDGDNWAPGDDTMNEYFVAGNLLCTRWKEGDAESREWWEISIDGDTMKWTALRQDKDGKTFTPEFEMTKVEE